MLGPVGPRLDRLPGDLVELATRCLAVDPRLRWPDLATVRERLQEARRARPAVGATELAHWVHATLASDA